MRPVEQIEVDFDVAMEVASHEALIRQTYKDSEGILTWNVGMTNATGHSVERYIGEPASLQHCMNLYAWALTKYAAGVRKAFAGHKLTKAQFAAALSFHWNTGAIGRATWVKKWKVGNISGARKSFMAWSSPKAIIPRRRKERDLFFDGKWSNNGTMGEYTRLTRRMTPVWASRKQINVRRELRAAFAKVEIPAIDHSPQPNAPVTIQAPGKPEAPVSKSGAAASAVIVAGAGAASEVLSPDWTLWAMAGAGALVVAIVGFVIWKHREED